MDAGREATLGRALNNCDTENNAAGAEQPGGHPSLRRIRTTYLEIPRKVRLPPLRSPKRWISHFFGFTQLDNVSLGIVKDRGFIGKSSEISLVNAAINLKVDVKREQHSHCQSPEQSADDHVEVDSAVPAWPSWRLEYWRWKPVSRRIIIF
jgi:hypothetical protein